MQSLSLTERQHELLDFIKAHLTEFGTGPSFREMQDELEAKSISQIHRLLTSLEERGHIVRAKNRARAISVVAGNDAVTEMLRIQQDTHFIEARDVIKRVLRRPAEMEDVVIVEINRDAWEDLIGVARKMGIVPRRINRTGER